jgi:hypothetical protein
MNNIRKYGSIVAGFLASAGMAFAQTPAYTMDSGVQTAATDLLTSLTAQIFSIIPVAIGLVGGVVVTLFGLRWLIGFVRSNMHG